jgi:hypothetical protein
VIFVFHVTSKGYRRRQVSLGFSNPCNFSMTSHEKKIVIGVVAWPRLPRLFPKDINLLESTFENNACYGVFSILHCFGFNQ